MSPLKYVCMWAWRSPYEIVVFVLGYIGHFRKVFVLVLGHSMSPSKIFVSVHSHKGHLQNMFVFALVHKAHFKNISIQKLCSVNAFIETFWGALDMCLTVSLLHNVFMKILIVNSSPPSAAYMRQWTGSASVQIIACRLYDIKPLPEPMLTYCQLDL